MEDSTSARTPSSTAFKLGAYDNSIKVDVSSYRGMIGSLLYLTASRHDIMYATCLCERFQADPRYLHLIAVKRILAFAAHSNFKVYQMDVKSVFLNGEIDEEVYVE